MFNVYITINSRCKGLFTSLAACVCTPFRTGASAGTLAPSRLSVAVIRKQSDIPALHERFIMDRCDLLFQIFYNDEVVRYYESAYIMERA